VIYGFTEELSELMGEIVEAGQATEKEVQDDIWAVLDNLVKDTPLSHYIDFESDQVYIGGEVPGEDDETFGEFKARCEESIVKVFGDKSISWINDSFYS
jgi:hypothetical protein